MIKSILYFLLETASDYYRVQMNNAMEKLKSILNPSFQSTEMTVKPSDGYKQIFSRYHTSQK